jgi:hypothetical protein
MSDFAFKWALIDHFVGSKPSKNRSQTIGARATISGGVAFRTRLSFVWTVASAVPLTRLAPTTFSLRSSPGGCGWEQPRGQQPFLVDFIRFFRSYSRIHPAEFLRFSSGSQVFSSSGSRWRRQSWRSPSSSGHSDETWSSRKGMSKRPLHFTFQNNRPTQSESIASRPAAAAPRRPPIWQLSKLFQFLKRDSDIAHDTGKAFWLDGDAFNQLPSGDQTHRNCKNVLHENGKPGIRANDGFRGSISVRLDISSYHRIAN